MLIDADGLSFRELNERINAVHGDVSVVNCLGQRFLGAGASGKRITVEGIPGNALGAYLSGAQITVRGNAQDAVGDTQSSGKIIIHGDAGDALGYSMRGGRIYVKGNTGYRTGIHMKEYGGTCPVIIVGGRTGNFLGEYLAGGVIVVLNLGGKAQNHEFTGAGMHGGRIFVRADEKPKMLDRAVFARSADADDIKFIAEYLNEFASEFGLDYNKIIACRFFVLCPSTGNPYKQLYTAN